MAIKELTEYDIRASLLKLTFTGGTMTDETEASDESSTQKPKQIISQNPSFNVSTIIEYINEGLTLTSSQLQLLWVNYQQLLTLETELTTNLLKIQYEHNLREKVKKQRVHYKLIEGMSLAIPLNYDEFPTLQEAAKKMRGDLLKVHKNGGGAGYKYNCIPEDADISYDANHNPILFEEEYVNNKQKNTSDTENDNEEIKMPFDLADSEPKKSPFGYYNRPSIAPVLKAKDTKRFSELEKGYEGYHLFVLVHGYLGTAEDMSYFKDAVSLL